MIISVDGDRCTGHGHCYATAPDLLEDDDEGFVSLRGFWKRVPTGDERAAELAASGCPEGAVSIGTVPPEAVAPFEDGQHASQEKGA